MIYGIRSKNALGNKIKRFFAIIYWFVMRPKTFGVKCVIEHNGEVLMIKNSYGGWKNWMFPGGSIDKNETPEEAAKREVLEEVGIEVQDLRKIGEYTSTKEFKKDTVMVFAGESKGKEVTTNPKEIAEARWFKLYDLPEISEYSKLILSMLYRKEI